jgi:LemA protein
MGCRLKNGGNNKIGGFMWKWIGLGLSVLMVVLVMVLALGVFNFGVNCYNDMVAGRQGVYKSSGCMKTEYQRRWDLIPNLCEAVKGYMKHEKGTLEAVILARASATQVKIDPKNLKELAMADENLGKALGRLLVALEQYPNLKADTHITQFMVDLKETENYVAQARNNYNETVQKYNTFIQKFPVNLLAKSFGFISYEMFEIVNKEAVNAPKIQM